MENLIYYISFSILPMLLGLQIDTQELRLLCHRHNYRVQSPQWVTFGAAALALVVSLYHLYTAVAFIGALSELYTAVDLLGFVVYALLPLVFFPLGEWLLGLLQPRRAWVSWAYRILLCLLLMMAPFASPLPFVSFLAVGMFLRNSPFGIPHGKDLWIAHYMTRQQTTSFDAMDYVADNERPLLPSENYAGLKRHNELTTRLYDVTKHGIVPNSPEDATAALQRLIDQAGASGGGIIRFPAGRFLFNVRGNEFIQINHSNITLEGEVDSAGHPLTTLVNCGKTSRGHKNPWVSPFFITTGEALQPSNEFWGLQFRRRKGMQMQSNSLADPGGDGSILSPSVTARVTLSAKRGDTLLKVDSTAEVGRYILVGLYNTSPDGNLIRDILGRDELRPEWTVAQRAGDEEAPSYQWLVEVARVIDDTTLELVRPLLRDIDLEHDPVVCNVEMLEHINICNLCIESRWNGQFRHHGFPLYYNVTRTQEMDYGWNAINMKRCAHSEVSNVVIRNFTNPLYVLDSRNVTVRRVEISGYDGHQGLKAYMHTCDCLFEDITFRAHFADMMGAEGPAYANVFRRISYLNPVFRPVDYDFHGFASEPMSPPSDNMFTRIYGFRLIKAAGSLSHQPSCARRNVWWNVLSEGERPGDYIFFAMSYRQKQGLLRIIFATGYAVAQLQKTRRLSFSDFVKNVVWKLDNIDQVGHERSEHKRLFFADCHVYGMRTTGRLE